MCLPFRLECAPYIAFGDDGSAAVWKKKMPKFRLKKEKSRVQK